MAAFAQYREAQAAPAARDAGDSSRISPATRLKILLDARKLHHGGIGVYISNLIAGLCHEAGTDITVVAHREVAQEFSWYRHVQVLHDTAKPYSVDEFLGLPRRISFKAFDVFHAPHYTLPFNIPIPAVVTIHDTIHISHPEKFYYPFVAKRLIRSAVRRAEKVVVVSEATKRDVLGVCANISGVLEKVHCIPNSIDPFFSEKEAATRSVHDPLFRYGLSGSYLLVLASLAKPHKGLTDLIAAFQLAKAQGLAPVRLVVAGQGTTAAALPQEVRERALRTGDIHFLGKVAEDELRRLLRGSLGLVVPSRVEGFCLPAVQAHACGVPFVARPVPAVRELATDEDIIAKDFSTAALATALLEFTARRACASVLRFDLSRFDRGLMARSTMSLYDSAYRSRALGSAK